MHCQVREYVKSVEAFRYVHRQTLVKSGFLQSFAVKSFAPVNTEKTEKSTENVKAIAEYGKPESAEVEEKKPLIVNIENPERNLYRCVVTFRTQH